MFVTLSLLDFPRLGPFLYSHSCIPFLTSSFFLFLFHFMALDTYVMDTLGLDFLVFDICLCNSPTLVLERPCYYLYAL